MKKIEESRKQEFLNYYNQGLNDYEIAKLMGISDSTTFRWRKGFGLPPMNTKPSLHVKETIPTEEQLEILSGTLLGDSCLQYYPKFGWSAPKFKCDHGIAQKEYAELLDSKLKTLGSSLKVYSRVDKRRNVVQTYYTVVTGGNQYFHLLYNSLYKTGKKEVCKEILEHFTIKSLAYLYMDDGFFHQGTADICTESFSKESVQMLVEYFKERFDLHFGLSKRNKGYRLRLHRKEFSRFVELISPHVIDSLKYKLNTAS